MQLCTFIQPFSNTSLTIVRFEEALCLLFLQKLKETTCFLLQGLSAVWFWHYNKSFCICACGDSYCRGLQQRCGRHGSATRQQRRRSQSVLGTHPVWAIRWDYICCVFLDSFHCKSSKSCVHNCFSTMT